MLISFDGIDSSGKETQAEHLAARVRGLGRTVHTFATPDYATESGKTLKQWLQGKNGNWDELPWREKMKLFADNRAEHRDEIIAALERGEVIIHDRYVPSSLAFIAVEAGEKREHVHAAVEEYEYKTNRMPREDISIFLDVPPDVAGSLLEKRKHILGEEDEYTDHLHVMERLYNEYDIMCQADPKRYLRIRATQGTELLSIEATAELIWEGLSSRFPNLEKPK